MKENYLTVTGFSYYHGLAPLRPGKLVLCRKEPDNPYDPEAIYCTVPVYGKLGYVANSVGTVAGGTMSAGRLYDNVCTAFYARVMFTTQTKVICRVEDAEPSELKKEILTQYACEWDDELSDDEEIAF